MKTDNTKLDIEGIRERHETMEAFKCNTPSLQTTHTDRGNLLIEVTRLRGDNDALREWMQGARHMKHCMMLDSYDERAIKCTCKLDELLNKGVSDE